MSGDSDAHGYVRVALQELDGLERGYAYVLLEWQADDYGVQALQFGSDEVAADAKADCELRHDDSSCW